VSIENFLQQNPVKIVVPGQYILPNWYDPKGKLRTFACRTNHMSPYRMIVDVPVVGRVGSSLTSYFREFGNLDGQITDTKRGGFLFEFELSVAQRGRLANKLAWLEEKLKDPSIPELRKGGARIVPINPHSTITLADGTGHECFIIDMSIDGVAVSALLQPPIGMPLAVGACIGRVVRHFTTGFAVKFVEKQKLLDLDRVIVRSPRPVLVSENRNPGLVLPDRAMRPQPIALAG